MKRAAIVTGILCLLGLVAYSQRVWLGNLPMEMIVKDDGGLIAADYGIIMMGRPIERAQAAVDLYRKGVVKKLVFAEAEYSDAIKKGYYQSDGVITEAELEKAEIPAVDVIYFSQTRNTSSKEELAYIFSELEKINNSYTAYIVTSWYHTSRAHWIAGRLKPSSVRELYVASTPKPKTWWGREGDFLAVFNEYLKWTYYLLKY